MKAENLSMGDMKKCAEKLDRIMSEGDEIIRRDGGGCTELLDDLKILYGVMRDAPQLNPRNYHDEVGSLITAMCEVRSVCKGILDRLESNIAIIKKEKEKR